jgi:O-antigen/teichoic acid export membrane protein
MFRRFSYYALARVGVTGAQLVFVPIAVVQVGAEGFGLFNLMLQLALLFRVIAVQAFNQVVIRDYSSLRTNFGEFGLYRRGLTIVLGAGTLVVVMIFTLENFIVESFHLMESHVWLAVAMGVAFSIFSLKHALLYCRDFRRYTFWEIAQSIGIIAGMVGLAALFPSLESYAVGYIVVTTAIAIVMLREVRDSGATLSPSSGSIAGALWSYGVPLAVAEALGWAVTVVDRFQIAQMLDPAQTGIYVAAFQLFVAPMSIVTMVLVTVLQPAIFGGDQREYRRRMEQTVSLLAVGSVAYVAVLAWLGPFAFGVFFRHQAEVDRLLVVVLALAGVATAYAQLQILAGKYGRGASRILKTQLLALALILLGNWLLLPRLGIMAAALTSLLACVVQFAILRIAATAEERYSFFNLPALRAGWAQLASQMVRSVKR